MGCSIVYNYVDLVVRNDTRRRSSCVVRVGERHLEGELRTDADPVHRYRVVARAASSSCGTRDGCSAATRSGGHRTDRRTGDAVGEELVKRNCALVRLHVAGVDIVDG